MKQKKSDLYPSHSKPGLLFGPAKIHKALEEGITFNPVISAIGPFTYNPARFCHQLLKPLTNYVCAVKGSFSFAKAVLEFDTSLFTVGFDMKSLFTNVILIETLNLVYKVFTEIKHMLVI